MCAGVGGFAGIIVMITEIFTAPITFSYVVYYFIKHFYAINDKIPIIDECSDESDDICEI